MPQIGDIKIVRFRETRRYIKEIIELKSQLPSLLAVGKKEEIMTHSPCGSSPSYPNGINIDE